MNAIKGKSPEELKAMSNEELSQYHVEINMKGKHHVYDYPLVCRNIEDEQSRRIPTIFIVEKVKLHGFKNEVYHAKCDNSERLVSLAYGEGKTKKEAIHDLKKRMGLNI